MPLHHFNPKLSDEAREAISAAFDSVTTFHTELASSSEKVVTKMAHAARVLGWPEPVVNGVTAQVAGMTKMHIEMMTHLMEAWQEQINSPNPMAHIPLVMLSKLQSWPGPLPAGTWPDAATFAKMAENPAEFWVTFGQQWQKNWAQMMTAWSAKGPTRT